MWSLFQRHPWDERLQGQIQGLDTRLARIEHLLENLIREQRRRLIMAQADIDKLKAAVDKQNTVTQSAVALINGLAAQIREAADDPTELKALAERIEGSADNLAAAVVSNTEAGPKKAGDPPAA